MTKVQIAKKQILELGLNNVEQKQLFQELLEIFYKEKLNSGSNEVVETLSAKDARGVGISRTEIKNGKSRIYKTASSLVADILEKKI